MNRIVAKLNVLVIRISPSSFVNQDINILEKLCLSTSILDYSEVRHIKSLILQFFYLLKNITKFDLIYIWFASYHSLIPALFAKIFGKKCIIVIGGHDAAYVPEYRYGVHRKRIRSLFNRASCRLADLLLPVSEFTNNNLFNFLPTNQRLKTYVIKNAIDLMQFQPDQSIERIYDVLSVIGTGKINVAKLKGVDLLFEIAAQMLDLNFTIIGLAGKAKDWCKTKIPPNVTLLDKVSRNELQRFMNASKVFCQLSRHDSFGMVLVEAMAMGCVPVGLNCGGTPEIMHDIGYISATENISDITSSIRKAIAAPTEARLEIHSHIRKNFDINERETGLLNVISELYGKNLIVGKS